MTSYCIAFVAMHLAFGYYYYYEPPGILQRLIMYSVVSVCLSVSVSRIYQTPIYQALQIYSRQSVTYFIPRHV